MPWELAGELPTEALLAGAGPLARASKQVACLEVVRERERAGRPPVRLGKRGRGRPSKAETALRRMGECRWLLPSR